MTSENALDLYRAARRAQIEVGRHQQQARLLAAQGRNDTAAAESRQADEARARADALQARAEALDSAVSG